MAALIPPNTTVPSIAANALVTPGTFAAQTFTDTAIKATAEDFIRALNTYKFEAQSTSEAIATIQASAQTILADANALAEHVRTTKKILTSYKSNAGAFDNAKAEALQFSTRLTALDSQVTALGLGARAAGLATAYNALAGNLLTIKNTLANDLPGGSQALCDITTNTAAAPPKGEESKRQEACYLSVFMDQVNAQVQLEGRDIKGVITPEVLYSRLNGLRSTLQDINQNLGADFSELNSWYDESNVVYTDNLTPSTTNLNIRVGINATEMFVPFTLNYSTTAPAAPAVPPTGHYESITEIVVQRRVHFNLVGGVLVIHVPTKTVSFTPSIVTTPAAGTSFMPCGGTSSVVVPATTTAPTFYCPTTAHSSTPATGVGTGSNIYTSATPPTITTLRFGTAIGIGFDLSVFGQVFKNVSAPGTP